LGKRKIIESKSDLGGDMLKQRGGSFSGVFSKPPNNSQRKKHIKWFENVKISQRGFPGWYQYLGKSQHIIEDNH